MQRRVSTFTRRKILHSQTVLPVIFVVVYQSEIYTTTFLESITFSSTCFDCSVSTVLPSFFRVTGLYDDSARFRRWQIFEGGGGGGGSLTVALSSCFCHDCEDLKAIGRAYIRKLISGWIVTLKLVQCSSWSTWSKNVLTASSQYAAMVS
jgi:hypothetical protein